MPSPKPSPPPVLPNYHVVRITTKAYNKIMQKAKKERRSFVATVDIIVGV